MHNGDDVEVTKSEWIRNKLDSFSKFLYMLNI